MSKKLIFGKNSISIERYDQDSKGNKIERLSPGFKEFNTLWDYDVEFSKGLTIENFLNNLKPFISEIQHTLSPYINCDIKDFYETLNKPCEFNLEEDFVDYIEMFWNCEVWEINEEKTGEKLSEFEMWGGYHGIPKNPSEYNISFGLTPLNNWKHYEFKLNNNLICYRNSTDKVQRGILFESKYYWTLFELLKNFFIELTFYGSLSDIEELKKVIEDTITDMGESKKISISESIEILNEIEIKDLEEELKYLVQEEKYEEAALIRNRINDLSKNKSNNN